MALAKAKAKSVGLIRTDAQVASGHFKSRNMYLLLVKLELLAMIMSRLASRKKNATLKIFCIN